MSETPRDKTTHKNKKNKGMDRSPEVIVERDDATSLSVLKGLEETIKDDENFGSQKSIIIGVYKTHEKGWQEYFADLTREWTRVDYEERKLRDIQGHHEDMHSLPDLITEEMDVKTRTSIVTNLVLACREDLDWYSTHTKVCADAQMDWGGLEVKTSYVNLQKRLGALIRTIIPLAERLANKSKRLEALMKSRSTNIKWVRTITVACDAILDARIEKQSTEEAGASWQIDDNDRPDQTPRDSLNPNQAPQGSPRDSLNPNQAPQGSPAASVPRMGPFSGTYLPPVPPTPFGQGQGATGQERPMSTGLAGGHEHTSFGDATHGIPTTIVTSLSLTTLKSLDQGPVTSFVNEANRLVVNLDATRFRSYLSKDVVKHLDTMSEADPVWTDWKTWDKDQFIFILEEHIIRNKSYVQSFEELLGEVTVPMHPRKLTTACLVESWKDLYDLLNRYAADFAKAETSKEQWKKVWNLFISMLEKGGCGKGKGKPTDISRTVDLRKDVANTLKKQCLSQEITTSKKFWYTAMKLIVQCAETFDSKAPVFIELARERGTQLEEPYSKKPRLDAPPKGGAGQGAASGTNTARKTHCNAPGGCGKWHVPPCNPDRVKTQGKPTLGMTYAKATADSKSNPQVRKMETIESFVASLDEKVLTQEQRNFVQQQKAHQQNKGKGKGNNLDNYGPGAKNPYKKG